MIPMRGITKHHDLASMKAIHPEVRRSNIVTEKDTFSVSTIIVGRICDVRMCARQMARDVRAKNMQVLDQIVTQLVGLKMIQLFPR
jgi:hypothetical protein